MTTVVTGASGHVGVNLVQELINKNQQVRALFHEHKQPLNGLDVDAVCYDICDLDLLKGVKGDRVVKYSSDTILCRRKCT